MLCVQQLRTGWHRRMAIWRLRLALFFTPGPWIEDASHYAVAALDRIGRRVEALSWPTVRSAIIAIRWQGVAFAATAPFVLPSQWRAALVRIFAYLGAIAALSLTAAEFVKEPDITAVADPLPRRAWIEAERPWPAFQLSLPNFADDSHYTIRRHVEGGGRKDTLSFGELGKTQRHISFEIYRAGREVGGFASAAEDIRALAAEQGRMTGLRGALPIPSKFGSFSSFEFAIGPFSGYHCVGFIRAFDKPRVQISGLSCNLGLLVDRAAISCALDKLSLVSAGSDPDIAKLFAQAELKRSFCGQRDALMYATPKRPGSDVTSMAKPRLRGRFIR